MAKRPKAARSSASGSPRASHATALPMIHVQLPQGSGAFADRIQALAFQAARSGVSHVLAQPAAGGASVQYLNLFRVPSAGDPGQLPGTRMFVPLGLSMTDTIVVLDAALCANPASDQYQALVFATYAEARAFRDAANAALTISMTAPEAVR